jgi:carbonic anhydrase
MYTKTTAQFLVCMAVSSPLFAADEHGSEHKWGYSGETGPAHWQGTCQIGKSQSPINIVSPAVDNQLGEIKIDYTEENVLINNNGHTIQITPKKSSITLGDTPYSLAQFHFHTPSENTIEGKTFPMEMHLVHKTAEGNIAVIGVLFESGNENPFLTAIQEHTAHATSQPSLMDKAIDISKLLPDNRSYYHFDGSLTSPPCTEGLKWYVLKTPLTASQKQLEDFQKAMGKNARPVQELNGRSVKEYTVK